MINRRLHKIQDTPENPSIVKDPNISTIVSTFQINLLGADVGEGSIQNGYRHALWQAIISSELGEKTALAAGNAHESEFFSPDIFNTSYKALGAADEVADQLNNAIGRDIATKNPKLTNIEYAKEVLKTFHERGLYQVTKNNQTFNVTYKVLNEPNYNKAMGNFSSMNLDQTGAGLIMQQVRSKLK